MAIIPILLILLVPQGSLIPAGTRVDARLESAVRTQTSSVGDSVVAVLTKPVFAANVKVIPEGSRLHGRVETLPPARAEPVLARRNSAFHPCALAVRKQGDEIPAVASV